MASCFFLLRQFKDVNIYLSSIKPYIFNDNVSAQQGGEGDRPFSHAARAGL